jgi:hypothetical protein
MAYDQPLLVVGCLCCFALCTQQGKGLRCAKGQYIVFVESHNTKSFPESSSPRLRETYYITSFCCSWPLLLLPVVQGASRTPTKTALDAMAEVFSDETSATSAAAKMCAPHSHRKNGLTPLRSPHARRKCGQFVVLFSED